MRSRHLLVAVITAIFTLGGAGVAAAQQPGQGTLVFVNDATGGQTYGATVQAFGDDDATINLPGSAQFGEVAPGERVQVSLPAGEHELIVFTEGAPELLGATKFRITAGTTTTVRASRVVGGAPETSTAAPAPPPVRVPTRVETGAGGTAPQGGTAPSAALVVLAGLAVWAGARRTTHRSDRS